MSIDVIWRKIHLADKHAPDKESSGLMTSGINLGEDTRYEEVSDKQATSYVSPEFKR